MPDFLNYTTAQPAALAAVLPGSSQQPSQQLLPPIVPAVPATALPRLLAAARSTAAAAQALPAHTLASLKAEQQQQPALLTALLQQRQALLQQQLHKVLTEAFALPQRYRGVLLFKLPVRPPSRAETDAWLLAQQAAQGTRLKGSRGRTGATAAAQQGIKPYGAKHATHPTAGRGAASSAGRGGVQHVPAAAVATQAGLPAAPTAAAADFRMDANTGRLVPVLSTGLAAAHVTPGTARSGISAAAAALAAATAAAAAAGGGSSYGGYGPSTQAGAEIEAELGLLSTPLLLYVPTQPQQQQQQQQEKLHRTQSTPTASQQITPGAAIDTQQGGQQQQGSGQLRLRLSTDSEHNQDHTTAAAAAGLPPSGGHRSAVNAAGPSHVLEEGSDDIEVSSDSDFEAPASPKYDERSFFFSAAAARSSARIRSSSRSQRRHSAVTATPAIPTPADVLTAAVAAEGGLTQPLGATAGGVRGAQAGAGGQPGYQRIHEQLKQAARRRSSAAGGGGAAATAVGAFALPASTPHAGAGAGSPDVDNAAAAAAASSSGGARTPPKGTAPPSLRLPGHTEHITPPTAAMGHTPASKAAAGGPAAAVRGASAGKAPSQLGFKQQRGSQGSGKEGVVPELRLAAVEVHADSRGSLLPDPR